MSASASGALAATVSHQAQQSPTGTPGTDTNGTATTVGVGTQSGAPSITFNDQQSSGQSVRIQSVTIPQPGFIVIYDSTRSGNETDQIIGTFHLLGAGTFQNIPVPLDTPINQSTSLTAVIHLDTNNNGRFDYVSSNGTQDRPLTPQGDRRIVDIAQVTVQSDSGSANTTDAGTSPSEAAATTASGSGGQSVNGTSGAGGSNGSSGAFGPGFGVLVGVGALLTVALLTVRRN